VAICADASKDLSGFEVSVWVEVKLKSKFSGLARGRTEVKLNSKATVSKSILGFLQGKMARPEGLEPPTLCFEGRCSIQLSYGRAAYLCNPITELSVANSVSP
jgi:hypothetical protein